MRAAQQGRIVMITSVGGRLGSPGLTTYCASKFALEGFGESLALEVAPAGIGVVIVEPGIVRTEIWAGNRNVAAGARNVESPYYQWFQASERLADWAVQSSTTTPEAVARVVGRALTARKPRLRYLIGRRANLLLAAKSVLPFELFEKIYFNRILRLLRGSK
jgi:NAD(P)-dependent dehydrogenase (short-subunit alcohol dehydrogenase family)